MLNWFILFYFYIASRFVEIFLDLKIIVLFLKWVLPSNLKDLLIIYKV